MAALSALPAEEQQRVLKALQWLHAQAQQDQQEGATDDLEQFVPPLQLHAAVAQGNDTPRQQIETVLAQLEAKGWRLTKPVQRIWNGERDVARLTTGLDPTDAALITAGGGDHWKIERARALC